MTVIQDIDIEAGDLSEFTATSGSVAAQAGAALAGTNYGVQVTFSGDTSQHYVQHALGAANTSGVMRARIYFDPNTLTMSNNTTHFLGSFYAGVGTTNIAHVILTYTTANGFRIHVQLITDSGSSVSSSLYDISDAPHYIEIKLVRATNSTSNDGSLQLWIDGVDKETISGQDNFDRFNGYRSFRLGALFGTDATTTGTYFIDQIVVNDDGSEIGPVGGGGGAVVPVFLHHLKEQGIA